jgi:hypothetical protein
MRKLLVTIAAMLAIAVFTAISDARWDSQGDRGAHSLPGSDHASAAGLADLTVAGNEERSRGRDTVEG